MSGRRHKRRTNLPSTITDADIAEMKRTRETVHAVSELFTAIAAHSATVAPGAEIAVKSNDLTVIHSLTWLLDAMTKTLQTKQPQMPLPRPRLDS